MANETSSGERAAAPAAIFGANAMDAIDINARAAAVRQRTAGLISAVEGSVVIQIVMLWKVYSTPDETASTRGSADENGAGLLNPPLGKFLSA